MEHSTNPTELSIIFDGSEIPDSNYGNLDPRSSINQTARLCSNPYKCIFLYALASPKDGLSLTPAEQENEETLVWNGLRSKAKRGRE